MAQSPEAIAKELVIARLSNTGLSTGSAERTGEQVGIIYKGVLQAVREGQLVAAGVSPEDEAPTRSRRPMRGR
jgi:hypothetical protein